MCCGHYFFLMFWACICSSTDSIFGVAGHAGCAFRKEDGLQVINRLAKCRAFFEMGACRTEAGDHKTVTQKNILFIMYDQLRFDYLSCAGHKTLHTPNFDRVAARGVRFTNAYVQSPVCGASRMSTYTGRYVASHGAGWNKFPIRVGEVTLGDHLRQNGMS